MDWVIYGCKNVFQLSASQASITRPNQHLWHTFEFYTFCARLSDS